MNVAEKLKLDMEEQRKKLLLQANEEEDKVIKKLEKQLGLNKSKNKNNYFSEDGLDCILLNIYNINNPKIISSLIFYLSILCICYVHFIQSLSYIVNITRV